MSGSPQPPRPARRRRLKPARDPAPAVETAQVRDSIADLKIPPRLDPEQTLSAAAVYLTALKETDHRDALRRSGLSAEHLPRIRNLNPAFDALIRDIQHRPGRRADLSHPGWRKRILDALRSGATMDQAAAKAGVATFTVARVRDTDPGFARQVIRARGRGESRWRRGDRDVSARQAHNDQTRAWRQELAAARFPAGQRRRLLAMLASGTPIQEAAATVGVTVQTVFGARAWARGWGGELDESLMAGRRDDISHGSSHSYKVHRCRCPECRRANDRSRQAVRSSPDDPA
jgi:hypothetical protein